MDKEMMKGSIDLLLLSLLEQRDLYGYEMIRILRNLSDDTYDMSEGTLYAALKRMEKKSWIQSYWSDTENGRRKYYRLTEEGKKEVKRKQKNWEWMNDLVKRSAAEWELIRP